MKLTALTLLALSLLAVPLLAHKAQEPRQEGPRRARMGDRAPEKTVVPEKGTYLPMNHASGWPVIEVKVNGKGPFKMLVDTGAATTVLNADFAAELELEVTGTTRIGDPTNPQANEAKQHVLGSIELGGARFEGVQAVSWEQQMLRRKNPELRGVLGIPTFADCTVVFDYPLEEMRIERDKLSKEDRGVVPFSPHYFGIPSLLIEVNGREVETHLDTGNAASSILPISLKDEIPLVEGSVRKGRGMRASGPVEFTSGKLDGTLSFAGLVFEGPEVRFDPGLDHGNIGHGVLKGLVLSVDQRGRLLRFVQPEDE